MPAASESGWWRLGFDLPDFVGVRLQRHVPTVLDSMAHHRMLCSDSRDGGIDVIHSEGVTTWDDETDVIVAGSGGGLVGAYTAAREGLSVMVVEATDQFGAPPPTPAEGGCGSPATRCCSAQEATTPSMPPLPTSTPRSAIAHRWSCSAPTCTAAAI